MQNCRTAPTHTASSYTQRTTARLWQLGWSARRPAGSLPLLYEFGLLPGRFERMPRTIAMAWFPQGELEKALERWPGFIERWDIKGHVDYCLRVDDELRVMTSQGPRAARGGADQHRRVHCLVLRAGGGRGPGRESVSVRRRPRKPRTNDCMAARAKRPLLVREQSEVQVVLRTKPPPAGIARRIGWRPLWGGAFADRRQAARGPSGHSALRTHDLLGAKRPDDGRP